MKKEERNRVTIHQMFWYFIIFSIIGLVIETIYCYITAGVIESRKGLIWGPLCPVYGVSATMLLIFLKRYQNKNIICLFIYGFVVGSVAEYILSYGLEAIYGMRFWDYGYANIHLNGRICLQYSIYWGILSVLLVKLVQPFIDKIIEKIPFKIRNTMEITIFIFLIINCIFTVWGIQTYEKRIINKEENIQKQLENNLISNIIYQIEEKYFTNERMSKTFPNLRIKNEKGEEVWIKTLISEYETN